MIPTTRQCVGSRCDPGHQGTGVQFPCAGLIQGKPHWGLTIPLLNSLQREKKILVVWIYDTKCCDEQQEDGTFQTLETLKTLQTFQILQILQILWTLQTFQTVWTLSTFWTLWTLWTFQSPQTIRTLQTLRTLWIAWS